MGSSILYQILEKRLFHGELRPGEEIGIRPDQLLLHDSGGPLILGYLSQLVKSQPKGNGKGNGLGVCYADHHIAQDGPNDGSEQRWLQQACARFKLHFSRAGNGISHAVHLARFAVPGQVVLGADTRTPIAGALGAVGLCGCGMEVAASLAGSLYYLICPAVMRVSLSGKLSPWVSARDVVWHILNRLAGKSLQNIAFEFAGSGLETLGIAERLAIAGASSELGVTTALFPSDAVTRAFLSAQARGKDFAEWQAEEGADYAEALEINLDEVVPMVGLPTRPLSAVPVTELAGTKVQQVVIGGCIHGSYEDLARAAALLEGQHVSPEVSLVCVPASRQVTQALSDQGYLSELLSAGARVGESGCTFCIGLGYAPGAGEVSVRTNSRNEESRAGSPGSKTYLVSPETAAATALKGELCDPRTLALPAPKLKAVKRFGCEDALIVPPPKKPSSEGLEFPVLTQLPAYEPLPPSLTSEVALVVGDHLASEQILTLSRCAKLRFNTKGVVRYLFEGVDSGFAARADENHKSGIFNAIIAGHNFGNGANPELIPIALRWVGVRIVLARSFDRAQLSNLLDHGIIPLTFLEDKDHEILRLEDDLEVPWIVDELRRSKMVTVRSHDRKAEFKTKHGLSRRQVNILLAGGLVSYLTSK